MWFTSHFLPSLLASSLRSPTSPSLLVFLHPLFRGLLGTVTSTLQHLSAYLTIEGVGSEAMDLARGCVEDALSAAAGGRGLAEWGKVLAQISSDLGGGALTRFCSLCSRSHADLGAPHHAGPALPNLSPPLLASLAVPPALEAQATAVRSILLSAFPSLQDKAAPQQSAAPPTPPRTPPLTEWDAVRRARLASSSSVAGVRSCLRCGRRTRAFDEPVVVPAVAGAGVGEGRWSRFEAEWEGRCVCGGMWTRVREGA